MALKKQNGRARIGVCAGITSGIALAGIAIGAYALPAHQQDQEPTRKSTEAPVASTGKFCNEIFMAIGMRNDKGLQDLLDKGGNPNSRNGLGFTPLYIAAASHNSSAVDILLRAGAKFDAPSTYGTPLTFATMSGNVPDAERFLGMGAKADYQRTDGLTPLIIASDNGCTPLVADYVKHKADLKNQDDGGDTALEHAAKNGHLDVGQLLIAAGANVNTPDVDGITPLMAASMNGHADFVNLLLSSGAKPNAKDNDGRTALLLTANYSDYPDVVSALLKGNANAGAKDKKGHTAAQLAQLRGFDGDAAALANGVAPMAMSSSRTPTQAVKLSLAMLQSSTKAFEEGATCISCHQEGLGRIATAQARDYGFAVDKSLQQSQEARIDGMVNALAPLHEAAVKDPQKMTQLPLIEMNEVTTMYSWVLDGMAYQHQPANAANEAMTLCLARLQMPDGSYTFALPREPMQSSYFSFTAYTIKAMDAYGSKDNAGEIQGHIAKAQQWLLAAKPQNSEDRASKLLGLKWSGADDKDLKDAAAAILADQRPDGGWSQLADLHSDAYATGQALYALHEGAGVPVTDAAYKRGVNFLLRTQDDDGTWYVSKRAMPANNYFDAGFPHGESQFASFNGTCWATLALLPATRK